MPKPYVTCNLFIEFTNGLIKKFPYMVFMNTVKKGIQSFIEESSEKMYRGLERFNFNQTFSMNPSDFYIPKLDETPSNERTRNLQASGFILAEHYGNDTTIIELGTFDPPSVPNFHSTIMNAVKVSESRNIRNLIIDLQGNSGGRVCLAIGLLNYLIPDFAVINQIYEPREFKQNSILTKFFSNSRGRFLKFETKQVLDLSFLTQNGNVKDFGNVNAQYSELFSINCGRNAESDVLFPKNATYFYDNIILLTDGLCGSACSLFATKLKLYNKARIYNIGGGASGKLEPFETSSFCGGSVLDYSTLTDLSLPKLNLTNAKFTFNVHHVYIKNTKLPREFIKISGDGVLPTWEFGNYKKILELVKELEFNRKLEIILGVVIPIGVILVLFLVILSIGIGCYVRRRKNLSKKAKHADILDEPLNESQYYKL